MLATAPAGAQLPTLGDAGAISSSAERKLGERIARELYRDPDYIDDPELVEYVQSLWQPLLAAARARGELTAELDERFAWQVLLGKDRTINAFALPGGWLGLHLGLVSVTSSRDEVASVLAHELSHVTQRHISRMVAKESQQTPWVLAAMILGAMAASRNPQAGGAVMAGSQALAAQQSLNFSRDMEREADRIGFGVATQAGFEPQGFVTMFEKLQQAARLNDTGNYPYLRTHPMTSERIADMQSRQQLSDHGPVQPTLEHALMAARARVISNPGVDALRATVVEADASGFAALPRVRQANVLYAATLAAWRLRDPAAVSRLMGRLDAVVAGDPTGQRLARLLAAEIALALGDNTRVLRTLDADSKRRPELLLTAQAQVQSGKAAEAAQRLQTWVATQPRDAAAWQLLSSAYAAQGQSLRAVRAEAEARVAQLDYTAALDRFKAAQDLVRRGAGGGDHIEASIIDTRARQVESALREQALER
ncbi:M48 family metalloprotease [Ramlibacter monticola]|uniref:M48 family metalloprotease n=1 Tax=Ramlibacter monticola TaxID=1926872 RepID=A0A936Z964_9BURK|nr:M48 family metalloprotease [Ramlibacter monticola]MBL0394720.1 M48 family metalloprotease [Ramlibacter monticola]